MKLRKLSVNVPLETPLADADATIEVLQGWIRDGLPLLADQLLIDVVDYRHVPDGPGILLVGHEAIYSLSEGGLRFSARRDEAGPAGEKIASAVSRLLAVAETLTADLGIGFDRDTIEVQVGDRLLAPTREALAEVTAEALTGLLSRPAAARPDARDPLGPAAAIAQIS